VSGVDQLRSDRRLAALAVVGLVALAFGRSLTCGFVDFDDGVLITDNPHLLRLDLELLRWAFAEVYENAWQPLTWLSLALDQALFQGQAWGFHLVNVALHAGSALVLFDLAAHLLAARRAGGAPGWVVERSDVAGGAVAALFFAIHPLRVESVTWATERKDTLVLLLVLLALRAWVLAARTEAPAGRWRALGWALLASLAKPAAVVIPALLLLLDLWPLARWRRRGRWPALLDLVPAAALAAGLAAITLEAQRAAMPDGKVFSVDLATRVLVAAHSLWTYLADTAWPHGLAAFYVHPQHVPLRSPPHLAALAGVLGLTALVLALARRQPAFAAAWGWWLVTLLPVLGLVQVGSQARADRFTYLPSVGLALLVGGLSVAALGRLGGPGRRGLLVAGGAWLAVMTALTAVQVGTWKDGVALWSRVLEVDPGCGRAWIGRAQARAQVADWPEAISDATRSIEIAEQKGYRRGWLVVATRAEYRERAGDLAGALADVELALQRAPTPAPESLASLRSRILAQLGQPEAAP
jgi:protein O-mannosyl-transferase